MLLLAKANAGAEFKVDAAKRQITGYASTFENVDLGDDVVMPGAFTKTLKQDLPAGQIRVKREHRDLIGKPLHAEQDSKGLLTVSQISKTPLGDETLVLAEDGVLNALSIGYMIPEGGKSIGTRDGRRVRQLHEVRLKEWSIVEDPMNPEAAIVGVKSLDDVCQVIDQMSYAVNHLRALSYVPAEIAARIQALLAELGPLASPYQMPSDPAQVAALSSLIGEFNSYLTTTRG